MMNLKNLFEKIEGRATVIPLFDKAITSGEWPDTYTVTIDSEPYYGLKDFDGKKNLGGSGDGRFHPSTHPFWGERRLFLAFHPEYKNKGVLHYSKTLQGEMTLAMGSAIHGIVQAQLQMAGLLREENVEFEYFIEEHNVRGRLDGILDLPNEGEVLWELKSQNSFSFKNQDKIKPSWDAQISMGLYATGKDVGILHLVEAGWPYTQKEFRVPRNDELLSKTFDKFGRVRDALEEDSMPPKCCAFKSAEMDSCPFKTFCYEKELS